LHGCACRKIRAGEYAVGRKIGLERVKRPVLWDHRIKDYHNRDFVDKE
jgi:hypothetical protein